MNFLERLLKDPVRFAWIKRGFYIGLAVIALAVRSLIRQAGLTVEQFRALL